MKEKEALKNLIDNPKQPNVSEWVYEVEAFLDEINESNEEAWVLIAVSYTHLTLPTICSV